MQVIPVVDAISLAMPESVYCSHPFVFLVCLICEVNGSDVEQIFTVVGGPE